MSCGGVQFFWPKFQSECLRGSANLTFMRLCSIFELFISFFHEMLLERKQDLCRQDQKLLRQCPRTFYFSRHLGSSVYLDLLFVSCSHHSFTKSNAAWTWVKSSQTRSRAGPQCPRIFYFSGHLGGVLVYLDLLFVSCSHHNLMNSRLIESWQISFPDLGIHFHKIALYPKQACMLHIKP